MIVLVNLVKVLLSVSVVLFLLSLLLIAYLYNDHSLEANRWKDVCKTLAKTSDMFINWCLWPLIAIFIVYHW